MAQGGEYELSGTGIELCFLEGDDALRRSISKALTGYGFTVRAFEESRLLHASLQRQSCHLLLLDVGRANEGMSTIAQLRAISPAGLVILTAQRSVDDRVHGLLAGADACLAKPVDVRLLVATLLSVYRRVFPSGHAAGGSASHGWSLSADGWFLIEPGGGRVALTPSERPVVRILIGHAGHTVARGDLMKSLGEYGDYHLSHRLDVLISRLRQKVKQQTGRALPLMAVRGVGFTFLVD